LIRLRNLLEIISVGAPMYLDDKEEFCLFCDEELEEDGTCPNGCDEEKELDTDWDEDNFKDDFEDIVPGRDYIEETDEESI